MASPSAETSAQELLMTLDALGINAPGGMPISTKAENARNSTYVGMCSTVYIESLRATDPAIRRDGVMFTAMEPDKVLGHAKGRLRQQVEAQVYSPVELSEEKATLLQKGLNVLKCNAGAPDGQPGAQTGGGILACAEKFSFEERRFGPTARQAVTKYREREAQKEHAKEAAALRPTEAASPEPFLLQEEPVCREAPLFTPEEPACREPARPRKSPTR